MQAKPSIRFGFLYLLLLGIPLAGKAQTCGCKQKPEMVIAASCEPQIFDNKARVFWRFNCDSAWLTFKAHGKKEEVLFALDSNFMELAGRLGYAGIEEYGSTFLIQNNLISGCCTPPEFHLFSKKSGKLLQEFGDVIYHGDQKGLPLIVMVGDSLYNRLEVHNADKGRSYFWALPKGLIARLMKQSDETYFQNLFKEPELKRHTLLLTYQENILKLLPPRIPRVLRVPLHL